MKNVPMTNVKLIANLQRQQTQTLDYIAQYRARIQMAEFYGLYRIAENGRAAIARQEQSLARLQAKLEQLGA